MSVTFLLALISQCRIPLVSEEELTGICVFRSCHTLFNFQGSLPVRQSSQPVAGGVSRGQLCYNTTSCLICQHLFYFFSGFFIFLSYFLLCVKETQNIPAVNPSPAAPTRQRKRATHRAAPSAHTLRRPSRLFFLY